MKSRDAKRIAVAVQALRELQKETDELLQLALIRRASEVIERMEQAHVDAARAAGATWSEIGEVYGLTKQGAQQRFRAR